MTTDGFTKDELAKRIQKAIEVSSYNNATQRELAAAIGITPQGFNNIIRGRDFPTAKTAIKMAEVFGCDLQWLLTGVAPAHRTSLGQAWNFASDDERRELISELMANTLTKNAN